MIVPFQSSIVDIFDFGCQRSITFSADPPFSLKKIEENTGIDQPAKDLTVTLTNGETFRLSDQKDKVVLVDFWSTHCPPCIEEFPNLRACYKALKHKGFDILSISLDNKKEELVAFLPSAYAMQDCFFW